VKPYAVFRQALPWLAVSGLIGCVTSPGTTQLQTGKPISRPAVKPQTASPPAVGSFISNGGSNLVANNAGSLTGTLAGPKAGLIANHGAGVLSNNAGGLIGNNAAGLIGNNAGGLVSGRELLATTLTQPVSGATVTVVDEGGRSLVDGPITSGADGAFKLEKIKASGPVVFLKATYQQEGQSVTLMAAVAAPRDKGGQASVAPASTLVAKKLLEMVTRGAAAQSTFNAGGLTRLAEAIAPVLDEKTLVAASLLPSSTAARVFDAAVAKNPQVKAQVDTAAEEAGLASLVAVTPTNAASPTPSTAPSASPSASTSPVTPQSPAPVTGPRVETFAGDPLYRPADGPGSGTGFILTQNLTVDAQGNVFVADTDNNLIRKITPDGTVSTVAGTGWPGYQDGPGAQAMFHQPTDVAVADDGTLFVTDNENDCIRQIATDGTVSTLAGQPGNEGFSDGTGTSARFASPSGLGMASDGHLYVADTVNNRIRHITREGAVTTVAGTGTAGAANGAGTAATFHQPVDVAFDASDNIYVAEERNGLIRKITTAGQVSNYVATSFSEPHSMVFDTAGNMYVVEQGANRIRMINAAKQVSVIAGADADFVDGNASAARFSLPSGISIDSSGALYVADSRNHRVRKLVKAVAGWTVSTLAGGKPRYAEGTGKTIVFNQPEGLAMDKAGNLYVADSGNYRVRAISPAGVSRTYAGGRYGTAQGTGESAAFRDPKGLAFDEAGNLFVSDSEAKTIRKIASNGATSLVAGGGLLTVVDAVGFSWPRGLVVTPEGLVVVDGSAHTVRRLIFGSLVQTFAGSSAGFKDGSGTAARFNSPHAVARDGAGNLYVADAGNHRIRQITPLGNVSTYAGTGTAGDADGPRASAGFNAPEGLCFAPDGSLIVADSGNHRIRRIAGDGTVTTVAGSTAGHADGTLAQARFFSPVSVVTDSQGAIYVTDFGTGCIRKIIP
jgi:sugar lactone lactonase YvrE